MGWAYLESRKLHLGIYKLLRVNLRSVYRLYLLSGLRMQV